MISYIPASASRPDHVLYRMFNHNNILVYVGITNTPRGRIGNHRDGKWWWPNIATITMQRFGTREELEKAERDEIRKYEPRYNIQGNPLYQYSARACFEDGHGSPRGVMCESCTNEQIVAFASLEEEKGEMDILRDYSDPFVPCTDNFYYPRGVQASLRDFLPLEAQPYEPTRSA